MPLLIDVPEGFLTANVVPYDPVLKILLPIGRVEHERNGFVPVGTHLPIHDTLTVQANPPWSYIS